MKAMAWWKGQLVPPFPGAGKAALVLARTILTEVVTARLPRLLLSPRSPRENHRFSVPEDCA